MARYQASMKMGALNLLILIIALSLTVLSVLTLVTAHANETLAQKQADSVTETYAEEIAGQAFLASLDKKLAPSKSAGSVASGLNSALRLSLQDLANEACEKAMQTSSDVELSSEAKLLSIKELYVEMKVSFDLRNDLNSLGDNSARSSRDDEDSDEASKGAGEEVIEDETITGGGDRGSVEDTGDVEESFDMEPIVDSSQYYLSMARALEECVGGVSLSVSTTTGRNLSVLIGIKSDGDYIVMSWKNSKIWYADEKKETLWMG